MKRLILALLIVGALLAGLTVLGSRGWGPILITREGEQKILLFFGKALAVTTPGVFARVPLLMDVETYPSLGLYLNVDPESIQTRDQERVVIDNYVVWRIVDPVAFRGSFPPPGLDLAQQQINRVVKAAVREVVGKRTLVEVLSVQRESIRQAITDRTAKSLADDGIAIEDVRINRTELPPATEKNVFARMKTDRTRLARKYRAEGEEQARTIRADADREARVTLANAHRDSEIARGIGDAEAARVYAEAYDTSPEFYAFVRTLEAYRKTLGEGTTLVLSPESEFFRYLGSGTGGAEPAR